MIFRVRFEVFIVRQTVLLRVLVLVLPRLDVFLN